MLLEAGQGLVEVRRITGADGQPDLEVFLDRSKISTVGRQSIGQFLLALQTHKSLGDVEAGTAMYNRLAAVPEDMIALRDIVMARKEPRKLLVQPHLYTQPDGTVGLREFEASFSGMVSSFVARFPAEDDELLALYHAEKADTMDVM